MTLSHILIIIAERQLFTYFMLQKQMFCQILTLRGFVYNVSHYQTRTVADVHCFLPCNALLQRVQYVMLCYVVLCYVMEDNYLLSCAASFSAVCSFHNRSSTRFLITSIRMMHSSVVVTYNKVSLTGLRK